MRPVPDDLMGALSQLSDVGLDSASTDGDWTEIATGVWEERWIKEKQERERAEDEHRFPRPLTSQFDLSDVLPSVLDGTPYQWPTRGGAIRGPDGVVHELPTIGSPTTVCDLWWARSEQTWRRTFESVGCVDCLANG